jgi:hypothetical protein
MAAQSVPQDPGRTASVKGIATTFVLLQNAIKRILQARNLLGVRAVVVEAKNAAAQDSIESMVSGSAIPEVDIYRSALTPAKWHVRAGNHPLAHKGRAEPWNQLAAI